MYSENGNFQPLQNKSLRTDWTKIGHKRKCRQGHTYRHCRATYQIRPDFATEISRRIGEVVTWPNLFLCFVSWVYAQLTHRVVGTHILYTNPRRLSKGVPLQCIVVTLSPRGITPTAPKFGVEYGFPAWAFSHISQHEINGLQRLTTQNALAHCTTKLFEPTCFEGRNPHPTH